VTLDATRSTLANSSSVLRDKAVHSGKGNGKLEKDDFMNLFLTQMSNQDPTSPMDSAGMTAQMAQLGSMEQLQNLNKGMETLNKTQASAASYQALNFIGKDVQMDAGQLQLYQGGGQPVYFNLDQEASNVRISIEGADGSPVLNEPLGVTAAGKHQYVWNGLDDKGTTMADGSYKIRVFSEAVDGTKKEVSAYNSGRINQVEFKNGEAYVGAQGRQLPLSKIRSVDNSSQRTFGEAKPLSIQKDLNPLGPITKAEK